MSMAERQPVIVTRKQVEDRFTAASFALHRAIAAAEIEVLRTA